MEKRNLYVPIIVEALVVGENPAEPVFADISLKYDMLTKELPFASQIMNDAFANRHEKAGVHLHWLMPDALLKGRQKDDGSLEFYELPDCWEIRRICSDKGRISVKAWQVDSRSCCFNEAHTENDMQKTTIPWFDRQGHLYAYLGGARTLGEDAPKADAQLEHLTAVGAGNHMFAAFYPDCKTVFGFYDDMKDTADGKYTYQVTGYYSQPCRDPLYQNRSQILDEWHWKYEGETPETIVCHGLVRSVAWNGRDAKYPRNIPTGDITVSIGCTSAETQALYHSRRTKKGGAYKNGLERSLLALQYNCIDGKNAADKADSLIRMEEKIHASAFATEPGGFRWLAQPAPDKDDPFDVQLDEKEYKELLALNQFQHRMDRLQDDIYSLEKEIYDLWYQYAFDCVNPGGVGRELLEKIEKKLADSKQWQKELADLEVSIEDGQKSFEKICGSKQMTLKKVPEEMYYIAGQPVIQLAGDGVRRSFKQGFQSEPDRTLPCRTKVVDALQVRLPSGEQVLNAEDLRALCEDDGQIQHFCTSLLAEAVFTDTEMAELLGTYLSKRAEMQESLESLAEAVRRAQNEVGNKAYGLSVRNWEQPWNPLLMAWTFCLEPDRKNKVQDDSFSGYKLGTLDLEVCTQRPSSEEKVIINGTTMLSGHGAQNFGSALQSALKLCNAEDKEYGKVRNLAAALEKSQILSQQTDGFHSALQGRRQTPVLPVIQLGEMTPELVASIQSVIGHMDSVPDFMTSFLPVRSGRLKLERLRLIDSFGQYRDIQVKELEIQVAESMVSSKENEALLRPRLMVPCRIEFRWLSYRFGTETLDKNSTPVFGFIVPDFVDESVHVYAENGVFLGLLKGVGEACAWKNMYGESGDAEKIENGHLKQLVDGFLENKGQGLREFLAAVKTNFMNCEPSHTDLFMTKCFGRVLVLCRGGIRLREKGRPIMEQKLYGAENTFGYEKQKMTLRIGDGRKEQNGVVGFFKESPKHGLYSRFYVSDADDDGAFVKRDNTVALSLEDEEAKLTFLLDAEGKLAVTSGFLPVREVVLPPVLYKAPMENIKYMLRVTPLLALKEPFCMPAPAKAYEQWRFSYKNSRKSSCTIDIYGEPDSVVRTDRPEIFEGFLIREM